MVDFFISHASEDKESFVRGLANKLIMYGGTLFYDEYSIKLGDSITESINNGLSSSNCAIIVLSNHFFEKPWTNAELNALFNLKMRKGFNLLLIYHGVTYEEVANKYPLLADIKAVDSSKGIDKLCIELLQLIGKSPEVKNLSDKMDSHNVQEGFFISLYVSIPVFLDERVDKILCEIGNVQHLDSRIKIYLHRNKRLIFEFTDSGYKQFSLSTSLIEGKPKHFLLNIDIEKSAHYLMVDGVVEEQIQVFNLDLKKHFFKDAICSIGCGLELNNATSFILGNIATGRSLSIDQAKSFSSALDDLLISLGRKIADK